VRIPAIRPEFIHLRIVTGVTPKWRAARPTLT